jgi:hypothetical protein
MGWSVEKPCGTPRPVSSTPPARTNANWVVTLIGCLVFSTAAWLLFQVEVFSLTWWLALIGVLVTLPFALAVLPSLSLVLLTAAIAFVIAGWLLSLWVPDLQPPVSFTADRQIVIHLPGTDDAP